MHHLVRTRSQHFVSSPRKTASPLIHKHTLYNGRHPPPKRRRLTSSAFVISRPISESDSDTDSESDYAIVNGNASPVPTAESSRKTAKNVLPLSSQGGQQVINKAASGSKYAHTRRKSATAKKDDRRIALAPNAKGKEKAPDVFADRSDDSSSPRKRKRSGSAGESEGDSGSWIEMDEDEQEPEFIAENDQHLLDSAPAYALHRLRKAELIRLWKVAGMWAKDDGDISAESAEDDDGVMSKKDLVDGLIAARNRSSDRLISPLPSSPRGSPRRKVVVEITRSRSNSQHMSSTPSSASHTSESDPHSLLKRDPGDTDVTPRAQPRTRSKVRLADTTIVRTAPRRTNGLERRKSGVHRNGVRGRSKSMGGDREDKRARFGDEVKSPAKGLINRRTRRSSTLSSAYTTTDTSPPEEPSTSAYKQTPRPLRKQGSRRFTPARRHQTPVKKGRSTSKKVQVSDVSGEEVVASDDEENDEVQATPLVQRLRSRGGRGSFVKEFSSEVDADDEENEEEDGEGNVTEQEIEEADEAPVSGRTRRLRTRDKRIDSDVSMDGAQLQKSGTRPLRGAKARAMQALKDVDSDSDSEDMDVDVGMGELEIDDEEEMEEDEDDGPTSGRMTRAKVKAQTSSPKKALLEDDDAEDDQQEEEQGEAEENEDEGEDETAEDDEPSAEEMGTPAPGHTTRSGKAFGVMQSRRKRLRQEAMDDPDMDVDGEEEEDETDDDSFEVDVDLSEATVSSLTRLLRDELVQMCEARGIEVGGTKPQLAKALIEWRDEQNMEDRSNSSSQATARPGSSLSPPPSPTQTKRARSSRKIIHAVATAVPHPGKPTPVLLRDHIHATDPATPPHSDESKPINSEAELNLDLSELGLEDSMIKPQYLTKLEKIGSGGFKDVYVGKLRGRKVAISEFRGHLSEMDIRELKLLAEFSHPNIVKFRGICIPEDSTHVPCMLVSELCENGDLFDYIRNVDRPSLKRLLNIMLDISRGLEYLHTRSPSIIHRDCKSSNILINRQGQAKVGDFGLARVKNSTRSMIRSLVGTVNWQAPELWHPHPRYDYKVDVFSAGMVFWEMMSGWIGEKKYPWEGHNEHYIYDAVGAKHKRPSIAGLRKQWGDEPVNLMERMWHQDPAERPTMTDVVADLESLIAEL